MGVSTPINLFLTILTILFLIGIFTPIVQTAFNSPSISESHQSGLENIYSGSGYLSIGLNLISVLVWTFGLPWFWNLILIIPRIIGLICLWYIIWPTK